MSMIRVAPLQPASVAGFRPSLIQQITVWRERRRTRLALAGLDAHLLRDIGLHELMAQTEAEKPFWKA